MTIQESIDRLKEGNYRFVMGEGKWHKSSIRKSLLNGQAPYAIILSCSDSRVIPEFIFDTGLGELFVIRVAGNIADTSCIASIEYAVAHCGSRLILVLAHQHCGAVTAAVKGKVESENLRHLLAHIAPVINTSESIDTIAKKNAVWNAKSLAKSSEIIKDRVKNGSLKIISAYYHLDSGKVDFLN